MATPTGDKGIDPRRNSLIYLLATGALAAVAAVILALVVYLIARAAFDVDFNVRMGGADSEVFTVGATEVIVVTVLGAVGATVLYGLLARFRRRPLRVFQGIAIIFLLLSLIPVLTQPAGVSGETKAWLAVLHVVVGGAIIAVFTLRDAVTRAAHR